MRSLACERNGVLLERRESGLSEADRLRLEQHLSTCGECAGDANALSGMRALAEEAGPVLSASARRRALSRAFVDASVTEVGPSAHAGAPQSLGRVAAPVLAVAAAALLAWWFVPRDTERAAVETADQEDLVAGRVLSGTVDADGTALGAGSSVPADIRLDVRAGARIAVAHATADFSRGAAIRWVPREGSLHLLEGKVEVEVDPQAHAPFHVRTTDFTVDVTGTRFTVDATGVHVERGSVRVRRNDGEVVAELETGDSWTATGALSARATVGAATPIGADTPAGAPVAAGDPAGETTGTGPLRVGPTVAARLDRARGRLADGDVAAARRDIVAALGARPSRSEAAEGRTLLAECALVSGDGAAAARAYLLVARRYGDLPAGQNALFAAARLRAEAGAREEAGALLRRYLARYPSGRFAADARRRLAAMGMEEHQP